MFGKRSTNRKLRKRWSRRRLFRKPGIDSRSREIDFDLDVLDSFVPILELLNESDVFALFADENASFVLKAGLKNVLLMIKKFDLKQN